MIYLTASIHCDNFRSIGMWISNVICLEIDDHERHHSPRSKRRFDAAMEFF